ncbi:MAG: 4'-phosphopantetheinyl transferase superfamily protein [Halioglobus sp.]
MALSDVLGPFNLHIWLCRSERVASSAHFSREILSRYASLTPHDWRFKLGEHGKPHIANEAIDLEFNLSHSRDWLACAVTDGCAVGVDIEYCQPEREFTKLARRFFTQQEYEALKAMPAAERCARFYDLWTLKEARVKASGAALGNELPLIGFAVSNPATACGASEPMQIRELPAALSNRNIGASEAASENTSAPEKRHYSLFNLPGNYRLASCVHQARAGSPQVALFEWRGRDDVSAARYTVKACSTATQCKG